MRLGRLGIFAIIACVLIPSLLGAELLEEVLLERWEVDSQAKGTSDVFFGRTPSGRFLFKRDGRSLKPFADSTRVLSTYGNLEGELLASRILGIMGVLTPRTSVVGIEGMTGKFLRANYMDEGWPEPGRLVRGAAHVPAGDLVDLAALRRLQVIDLWIGNADRHQENIWFHQKAGTTILRPVAFDHSFAFGDQELAPGWPNGAAFSLPISVARTSRGAFPSQTSREILYRNPLYRGALAYPEGLMRYFEEAACIQHLFPDTMLGSLVASLPRQAFGGRDPLVRRTKLHDGLKQRRDALLGVLEGALRSGIQGTVGAMVLDSLPAHLQAKLPTDRSARAVLEVRVGAKRAFELGRLEEALGETPLNSQERRQALQFLMRQAGHPVDETKWKDRHRQRPSRPRPRVPAGLLRAYSLPVPSHPPTEWMLVREPGGLLRGAAGEELPPPENPVHLVMAEALERLPPGPTQLLRTLYLPGSPGHYHAILQASTGEVLGQVFLAVAPIEDLSHRSGFSVSLMGEAMASPWDQMIRPPRPAPPTPDTKKP